MEWTFALTFYVLGIVEVSMNYPSHSVSVSYEAAKEKCSTLERAEFTNYTDH